VVPTEKHGRKKYNLFHTDYNTVSKMLRIHSDQLVFLGVKPVLRDDLQGLKYGKEPLPAAKPIADITDVGQRIAQGLTTPPGSPHKDIETWFAVDLPDLTLTIDPTAEVMPINQDLLTLSPEEAALCAQARSLLDWHLRNKLCPSCGSPTQMKSAGYRRQCSNEDCITRTAIYNSNYPRLDPSVITLIVARDQNMCLLGRQPRFPANMYSCLAGFIEPGESIEDAVAREVSEEVGILVNEVEYVASQPWPMPSSLMLGLMAYVPHVQQIKLDTSELEGASWFTREEAVGMLTHTHRDQLFLPPAQAIGHQLVRHWVKKSAFREK
jgi:NADH pyrophosphatase NudC (nudix superfamily)